MIEFTKEQNHAVLQFMWPDCVKTTEGYAKCVALNRPVTVTLQGDYVGKQNVSTTVNIECFRNGFLAIFRTFWP